MKSQTRPVLIGEVLFDVFPNGRKVLGGAPFNVAWNLQGLGLRPLLITRVGEDCDGEAVMRAMAEWNLETSGVQLDSSNPTGRVQVGGEAGEPVFDILPEQAYDRLDVNRALDTISHVEVSMLYHGSLILRNESSERVLNAVRSACDAPIFVDVNLRDPWWDAAAVLSAARGSTWIKLNEIELARLTGRPLEHVAASPGESAEHFRVGLGASFAVVTRGPDGAVLADGHRTLSGRPSRGVDVIDTVGAGDAFSAVTILGVKRGWSSDVILDRALEFASAICEIRGATSFDRGFYEKWRNRWESAGS